MKKIFTILYIVLFFTVVALADNGFNQFQETPLPGSSCSTPLCGLSAASWGTALDGVLQPLLTTTINSALPYIQVTPSNADPTGANDSSTAIMAACASSPTNVVYLPPGLYTAENMTPTVNCKIVGAGSSLTKIQQNSGTGWMFILTNGEVLELDGVSLFGSNFSTPTAGGAIRVGVDGTHSGKLITHDIGITAFWNGIEINNGYNNDLWDTGIYHCLNYAIHLNAYSGQGSLTSHRLTLYMNTVGLQYDSWDSSSWIDTWLTANIANLVVTGSNGYVESQYFTNLINEGNGVPAGAYSISIQKLSSNAVKNISIKNLDIVGMNTTATTNGVLVGNGVTDITIDGGRTESVGSGTGTGAEIFSIYGQNIAIMNIKKLGNNVSGNGAHFYSTATGFLFEGNDVSGATGYGLQVDSGATGTLIGNWYVSNTLGNKNLPATGVLDLDTNTLTANYFLASPSGSTGGALFRHIVPLDLVGAQSVDIANFVFDSTPAISTPTKTVCQYIPFAETITGMSLEMDTSATVVIKPYMGVFSTSAIPSTDISGGNFITTSAARGKVDTTLSGWTTAVPAGDEICAQVTTNDDATNIHLKLFGTR